MEPPQLVEDLPLTVNCPVETFSDKTAVLLIIIILTIMYNYTDFTSECKSSPIENGFADWESVDWESVDWDSIYLKSIDATSIDSDKVVMSETDLSEDGGKNTKPVTIKWYSLTNRFYKDPVPKLIKPDSHTSTEPEPKVDEPKPVAEPVPEHAPEPVLKPDAEPLPEAEPNVEEPLPEIVKGTVFYTFTDGGVTASCPALSGNSMDNSMDNSMESIMGAVDADAFYRENSILSMAVFITITVISTLFHIVKFQLYQGYVMLTYLPLLMYRSSGFAEKLLDEIETEYEDQCITLGKNVIRGITLCTLLVSRLVTSFVGRLIFNQTTLSYLVFYIITRHINHYFSQSS